MSKTEPAKYRFTVKKGKSPPFIMGDPAVEGVTGRLAIELKSGTTHAEAQEFAEVLNEKISTLVWVGG
jgi:hypothetical protein